MAWDLFDAKPLSEAMMAYIIDTYKPWSASPICIRNPTLVITVTADGLAPDGARPSVGTVPKS